MGTTDIRLYDVRRRSVGPSVIPQPEAERCAREGRPDRPVPSGSTGHRQPFTGHRANHSPDAQLPWSLPLLLLFLSIPPSFSRRIRQKQTSPRDVRSRHRETETRQHTEEGPSRSRPTAGTLRTTGGIARCRILHRARGRRWDTAEGKGTNRCHGGSEVRPHHRRYNGASIEGNLRLLTDLPWRAKGVLGHVVL
ncbi:unnamed protein product [Arctogadus glacialis]